MVRRLLAVVSLTACAHAARSAAPERPIDLAGPDRYPPPPVAEPAGRCAARPGGLREDAHGYELEPMTVRPLAAGPRIREAARERAPRSRTDVVAALEHEPALAECYRWARARAPEWEGALPMELEVDVLGRVVSAKARATERDLAPLRTCVEEVLTGVRVPDVAARPAIASVTLDFRARGPSRRADPPPSRPVPVPPVTCTEATLASSSDRLDIGRLLVEANVTGDRTSFSYREPLAMVRRSFGWNLGSYQRCLAEASARRPGIGGRIELRVDYAVDGDVARAEIVSSDLSDPALAGCVLAAAREQWLDTMGGGGPVAVIVPLVLAPEPDPRPPAPPSPASVSAVEAHAVAALARGHVEVALRAYGALLTAGAGDARRRCGWHAGALRSALAVAPWIDARVLRASDELVDHVAAHRAETTTCLAEALPALERLFLEPLERVREDPSIRFHPEHVLRHVAIARGRRDALLARAPFLAGVVERPRALEPSR